MPHRFTHVVILATLATTAVWDRPAFADAWFGSASCKIHAQRDADPTTGKGGYVSDETPYMDDRDSSGSHVERLDSVVFGKLDRHRQWHAKIAGRRLFSWIPVATPRQSRCSVGRAVLVLGRS
jgi:hypothetical protein